MTPFDADDDFDADALASHVETIVDAGLDGIVPCGTTGEFASLTDEERRTAVETTVEAANGRVPVIAGAADTTVSGVRDRLRFAAEAGADAGLITLPYYHTSTDPDGQRAFFERVADDAPLPIYLYDIPATVGESIDPDVVADLAAHESVVGLKDTSGDISAVDTAIDRTSEEFTVFQGVDALLYPSASLGVDGGINALSQVIPRSSSRSVRRSVPATTTAHWRSTGRRSPRFSPDVATTASRPPRRSRPLTAGSFQTPGSARRLRFPTRRHARRSPPMSTQRWTRCESPGGGRAVTGRSPGGRSVSVDRCPVRRFRPFGVEDDHVAVGALSGGRVVAVADADRLLQFADRALFERRGQRLGVLA